MGLRILSDTSANLACMYCSTSDHAFGPVFYGDAEHDGEERLEAFLRWAKTTPTWPAYENFKLIAGHRDPRELTEAGLERAYSDWLAQEAEQWKAEDAAEEAKFKALEALNRD